MKKITLFLVALFVSIATFAQLTTGATQQEVPVDLSGGKMIYLKVSDKLWVPKGHSLWMLVYSEDRGCPSEAIQMKQVEGEEFVFYGVVPVCGEYSYPGIGFYHLGADATLDPMNPAGEGTDYITAATVGKNNMFTVEEGKDGKATGTWSVYAPAALKPEVPVDLLGGKMIYLKVSDKLWVPKGHSLWMLVYSEDRGCPSEAIQMKQVEGEEFVFYGVVPVCGEYSYPGIGFYHLGADATLDPMNPAGEGTDYITAATVGKNNMFTVEEGKDGKVTGTWSVYGLAEEPEPEPEPELTQYNINFDNNGLKWEKVYIYLWDSLNTENVYKAWPGYRMTTSGITDGFAKFSEEIPVGYNTVIFNNGDGGSQTANIALPEDYVGYKKIVYSKEEEEWFSPGYFVAGSAALCHGKEWAKRSDENKMNMSGLDYSITYENLPAGSYDFKVTLGTWASARGYENVDATTSTPGYSGEGQSNISFSLPSTDNITISINRNTQKITLKAATLEKFAEWEATSYTLCGDFPMLDWVTSNAANHMEKGADGVWTKTYDNVKLEAKEYQYKVAANDAWGQGQFPTDIANQAFTVTEAGLYKLTFTYNPAEKSLTCAAEKIVPVITATWSIAEGAELEAFENVTVTFAGIDSVGRTLGVEVTEVLSTTSAVKILYSVAEDGTATAIGILPATKNGLSVTYAVAEEKGYDLVEGKLLKNGNYRIVLHKGNLTFNPRRKDENETNLPAVKNDVEFVLNFSIKNDYKEPEPLVAVEKTFTATPENKATVAELKEIVITYPELEMIRVSEPLGSPNQLTWAFLNQTMISTDEETGNTSIAEQAYCPLMSSQTAPNAFTIFVNLTMKGGPESLTQEGTWSVSVPEGLVMFSETEVNKAFTLYYTVKAEDGPTVDVENTIISSILVQDGMIVADGEYQIYTITGQNVTGMNGSLAEGVYVVKAGNSTVKVIVK